MRATNATPRPFVAVDRSWLIPAGGGLILVVAAALLGPEGLMAALVGVVGLILVSTRPEWGVGTLLTMLMVQYGSRRFERTGASGIAALIPAGSGLLTVNNLLGLYLAAVLMYRVYRDGDWSFLKSRQVQLVALITVLLIFSSIWNGVDYAAQIELGLRVTGQDPMRTLGSRALFLVLFIAFIHGGRELRLLAAIFVVLSLITAYSGSTAALTGTADAPQAAEYRAGGLSTLIETAGNPNRLAMVATLAFVFLWEFGQAQTRPVWSWVTSALCLYLVLTVFLTASRGGVLGLSLAALLLFVRRRNVTRRMLYGGAMAVLAALLFSQMVPEANRERLSNIPGLGEDVGEGSGSIERRGYTYGVGFNIWMESPLIGVGMGNWEMKRFTTDPLHSAAVPHNSFLLALAEGGVVGLGLYLVLFIQTIRGLMRIEQQPWAAARARGDGVYWLVTATRVCLICFMLFSMFSDLWELIFFYFLIGLGGALISMYGEPTRAVAHA